MREVRDTAEAAPYFFLSYAHFPWHESRAASARQYWLTKLFTDLCAGVCELDDVPPAAAKYVGFMDLGQPPGQGNRPWRPGRALATCRVFVPLFSPSYFTTEDCGKEWHAFTRRGLPGAARGRVPAIIPAFWVPMDARELPEAVRSVRFTHADLGEPYAENGFYGIIKSSKYHEAYEAAIFALAQLIVRAAVESPAPPGPDVDYATLVDVFGPGVRSGRGDRPLRITIVAPRLGELPPGCPAAHYGRSAAEWNPYQPELVRGLAAHAADVARSLGYRPEVGDLGQHRAELLRPGPPSRPAVLIVDAWAALIDGYASVLRRLNETENVPWVRVIVPWRPGDHESAAARDELWSALNGVLGHKLTKGRAISLSAVRGVPSLDDFNRLLASTISTAGRQYLRYAPFPPDDGPEVNRARPGPSLPDLVNTELPGA